jgi:hypothetical protein
MNPRRTPSAIDVFRARVEARAILCAEGALELHEAIDVLQADALANGLIAELGQDTVQAIISRSFAKVPHG